MVGTSITANLRITRPSFSTALILNWSGSVASMLSVYFSSNATSGCTEQQWLRFYWRRTNSWLVDDSRGWNISWLVPETLLDDSRGWNSSWFVPETESLNKAGYLQKQALSNIFLGTKMDRPELVRLRGDCKFPVCMPFLCSPKNLRRYPMHTDWQKLRLNISKLYCFQVGRRLRRVMLCVWACWNAMGGREMETIISISVEAFLW